MQYYNSNIDEYFLPSLTLKIIIHLEINSISFSISQSREKKEITRNESLIIVHTYKAEKL